MPYLPIEDHGIIGDLHTAALVGTDGTVDWLCLPAFDSPSVFASILDDEKGGHFVLRPERYDRTQQLYLPDTNVLLTRFLSPGGVAEILDFMPILRGPEDRHRLVRNVRVIRGRLDFEAECRPAFDYARAEHSVHVDKDGVLFEGPKSSLGLASELPLEEGPKGSAGARLSLGAGESATFVLAGLKRGEGPGEALSGRSFGEMLGETLRYWR